MPEYALQKRELKFSRAATLPAQKCPSLFPSRRVRAYSGIRAVKKTATVAKYYFLCADEKPRRRITMSRIRERPLRLRPRDRKREPPRIRIFHQAECECRRKQLAELTCMLMGAFVLARAQTDAQFREILRKVIFAAITDPEDLTLLRDFFPPPKLVMQ
jgi:hypothetical protein